MLIKLLYSRYITQESFVARKEKTWETIILGRRKYFQLMVDLSYNKDANRHLSFTEWRKFRSVKSKCLIWFHEDYILKVETLV